MNSPVLAVDNLYKAYQSISVLKDICFTIDAGEFIGLAGVNGAGKTTLIKCILDFCHIDSGTISIFGEDHRQYISRQNLTYLPERFTPPYYLTGRDFLLYMAELNDIEYTDSVTGALLTALDLDESALGKPVWQYSKGMGQKLGLMACFMSGRKMMIFDEPMSGLDPRARVLLKRYLLKLKQEGRTLFYSSHLLEDVEALCDRVIILHHGRICFSGSLETCLAQYSADSLESAYMKCVGDETL